RLEAAASGGVIRGGGAWTKTQGNTLTLTGNNTYSGVTTISSGGTLQIGAGSSTGAIVGNVTNNGTLTFNRSNDMTYGGVISGSGQFVKLAANKLTLTGDSVSQFNTTISAGTLEFGNGGTTGSLASN